MGIPRRAATIALLATTAVLHAAMPTLLARRDYAGFFLGGVAVADANRDQNPDVIGVGGDMAVVLLGNNKGTFRQGPTSQLGIAATDFSPIAIDLNGDGRADLIVSGRENSAWGVGICLGNGDGTFGSAIFYQAGADTFLGNVILGDFNKDGILDAVTVGPSGVWLFPGMKGGAFGAPSLTPFDTGGVSGDVVTADFDRDGRLDLVITTYTGFSLLLGNGDGTFQPPQPFSAAPWAGQWLAPGDLNGDGYPDIVLVPFSPIGGPTEPYIYLNNGNGGFSAPSSVALPHSPITIGDVNADGIPDLVSSSGYIALGDGDGTFQSPVVYPLPVGDGPSQVVLADLRHNGLTDLVFEDADGSISVLLALPKGGFLDGEWIPVTGYAGCGAVADYNGDGKPDLATNTPTGISILLGTGQALPAFRAGIAIPLPNPACLITGKLTTSSFADLLVPTATAVNAYLGNGDGTFTQKSSTPVSTPGFLALADFNRDGNLDFATSGNLLALGNGDGTFRTPVSLTSKVPLEGFSNIAAADVNGDGWPDVVLTESFYGFIYVLLNNHYGGFTETRFYAGNLVDPIQAVFADFNQDGNLDLAVAMKGGGAAVYLGDGRGGFTLIESITPANLTFALSLIGVSDVNGDGIPDLLLAQGGGGSTIGIFLGKGDGKFQQPFYVGAGLSPAALTFANLHGQPAGLPDIVAPDFSGGVMVLINTTAR